MDHENNPIKGTQSDTHPYHWYGRDAMGQNYVGSAESQAQCNADAVAAGSATCHITTNPLYVAPGSDKTPEQQVLELSILLKRANEEKLLAFNAGKAETVILAKEEIFAQAKVEAESGMAEKVNDAFTKGYAEANQKWLDLQALVLSWATEQAAKNEHMDLDQVPMAVYARSNQ